MHENFDELQSDILNGRWEKVIQHLKFIKLPQSVLMSLYEQIILELLELKEYSCSSWLFMKPEFQKYMKANRSERCMLLQRNFVTKSFDYREAYPGNQTKEKQRALIASLIKKELCVVAPSRLITLLGQALKWQQGQGLLPPGQHIDIFEGKTAIKKVEPDQCPKNLLLTMEVISLVFISLHL